MPRRLRDTILALSISTIGLVAGPTMAAESMFSRLKGGVKTTIDQAYGGGQDVRVNGGTFVGALIIIINTALTFVGIICFLFLIYVGYIWMNARGNEEEVTKAKKILREVVVAFLIILFARVITEFLLNVAGTATSPVTQ